MVAGTHSGVGKTTVATGLMAALRQRGLEVGAAKVGPDFIDPGYHQLATGSIGRNLDSFSAGPSGPRDRRPGRRSPRHPRRRRGHGALRRPRLHADRQQRRDATLLDAPVVLVVDASSMSSSVRALVDGYDHHFADRFGRRLGGVILNRVGSETHESLLREALDGSAPSGCAGRQSALSWRDRHLGLVPVVEDAAGVSASLGRLADGGDGRRRPGRSRRWPNDAPTPADHRRQRAARVSSPGSRSPCCRGPPSGSPTPTTSSGWRRRAAEIVAGRPGDGPRRFPRASEVSMRAAGSPRCSPSGAGREHGPCSTTWPARVAGGLAVWAECGGMLWLSRSLDGHRLVRRRSGRRPPSGPGDRRLPDRDAAGDTPIGRTRPPVRGHEHHYSTQRRPATPWSSSGGPGPAGGMGTARLLATYLHLHLGGDPAPAERFVACAADS